MVEAAVLAVAPLSATAASSPSNMEDDWKFLGNKEEWRDQRMLSITA